MSYATNAESTRTTSSFIAAQVALSLFVAIGGCEWRTFASYEDETHDMDAGSQLSRGFKAKCPRRSGTSVFIRRNVVRLRKINGVGSRRHQLAYHVDGKVGVVFTFPYYLCSDIPFRCHSAEHWWLLEISQVSTNALGFVMILSPQAYQCRLCFSCATNDL